MQTPSSAADDWLTQAMQASGAANQPSLAGPGFGSSNAGPGPAFDAGSLLIAGTVPLSSLAMPNPLQTHTV